MGTLIHRVSLFAAAGAVLFLAACSSDGNGTTDKKVLDITQDEVGTCLFVDQKIATEVSSLPTIDCAQPHTHEIYAAIVLTEADFPVYPGSDQLGAVAQRECTREFQNYVGSTPSDSTLFYSWLLPTIGSWNDHKDRTILCVAGPLNGDTMTGTIKDSKL